MKLPRLSFAPVTITLPTDTQCVCEHPQHDGTCVEGCSCTEYRPLVPDPLRFRVRPMGVKLRARCQLADSFIRQGGISVLEKTDAVTRLIYDVVTACTVAIEADDTTLQGPAVRKYLEEELDEIRVFSLYKLIREEGLDAMGKGSSASPLPGEDGRTSAALSTESNGSAATSPTQLPLAPPLT